MPLEFREDNLEELEGLGNIYAGLVLELFVSIYDIYQTVSSLVEVAKFDKATELFSTQKQAIYTP